MRVENTLEPRSIVPEGPQVVPVSSQMENGKLDVLHRGKGHGGERQRDSGENIGNALLEAMDLAEEHLKGTGLNIRLKTAEKSERLQVEVFDPETKEVLRRFPPDEIIRLAESLDEMAGLIVNRSF
ncbi:flagellar protein FlaG [Desulfonatronum thioautotrophicum]|uniref:flagellar protein FlaG n=1 Tax=Desulfonatronum thioautotrophicum TaxID=617001 RepID=UPI0005EBE299|nr:flagellar protein FlaG [Desulfonatronum thioautotrophicum]